MAGIKAGFKKAGKRFGSDVATGADKANKRYGLGGEMGDIFMKGFDRVKNNAKSDASNVKSIIVKPFDAALTSANTILTQSDYKDKLNEIAEVTGFTKERINSSLDQSLKDSGVTGISSFGELNMTNIKNLKSNLRLEDFKMDPKSFLPASGVDSEAMAKEANLGNLKSGLSLDSVNIDSFMNGDINILKIKGSDLSSLKSTGLSDKINIEEAASFLKDNKSQFTMGVDRAIDINSFENTFENQFDFTNTFESNLDSDFGGMLKDDGDILSSIKTSDLDSVHYSMDISQGFNDRHNIKDSQRDFTKTQVDEMQNYYNGDYLYAIDSNHSYLDAGKITAEDPLARLVSFESMDRMMSGDFSGSFYEDNDILSGNIDHARKNSKRYTDMWGKRSSEFSDQYSEFLDNGGGDFGSKFKVEQISLSNIFKDDFKGSKGLINLRHSVNNAINKLFRK